MTKHSARCTLNAYACAAENARDTSTWNNGMWNTGMWNDITHATLIDWARMYQAFGLTCNGGCTTEWRANGARHRARATVPSLRVAHPLQEWVAYIMQLDYERFSGRNA